MIPKNGMSDPAHSAGVFGCSWLRWESKDYFNSFPFIGSEVVAAAAAGFKVVKVAEQP